MEKLLDKLLEFRFAQCEKYVELGVDIVWLGDDFGMQDRMMINPELWRKLFKPRMKLLIDGYKKLNPQVFTQYHSDGYIEPIINDLIEIGVDILNPVQPCLLYTSSLPVYRGGRIFRGREYFYGFSSRSQGKWIYCCLLYTSRCV